MTMLAVLYFLAKKEPYEEPQAELSCSFAVEELDCVDNLVLWYMYVYRSEVFLETMPDESDA